MSSTIRYDVPLRELEVGDSVALTTGSLFWLIVEVDRKARTVRTHNQLAGRASRHRTFKSAAPVAIIRH